MFRCPLVSRAGLSFALVLACLLAFSDAARAQTGTVAFTSFTYSANASDSNAVISIVFTGSTNGNSTVDYVTSDGTATAGVDYVSTSNTSVFSQESTNSAATALTNSFDVPLLNNGLPQSTQTVNLALINPTGFAVVGTQSNAVLTIINTSSQEVQFAQSSYSVDESNVPVEALITVTRTAGSNGVATVDYNTSNGSALAGIDYTATSGTLIFSNGITSAAFSIPILETNSLATNTTVHLTLSNPTGGAALSSPSTALLTILATGPPVLQFSAASADIQEHLHRATLTVIRFGDSSGSASVDFATANGTAITTNDYLGTNGTLQFAPDQATASFSFQLQPFKTFQSNKTVEVSLSNVMGASLGPQSNELVTIVNDRTQTITLTNAGGDLVTLTLRRAGTMETNGTPMNLQLSKTDATSILTVTVKKSRTGSGFLDVGSLTGDGACRLINAPAINLVGAGVNMAGYLGQLSVHDIPNGGSVLAGGASNQRTRILAHVIGDGGTINVGGRIDTLSVARLGVDTIIAPSIGALSIRGDKRAMISGDCGATITLSGGVNGQATLGTLFAAGAIRNVAITVADGNVGSIAASNIVNSTISVGYTPDNTCTNASPLLNCGTLTPGLRLGGVRVSAPVDGFANSYCLASIIGGVHLSSVAPTNGGVAFGIRASQSLSSVSVKTPKFKWIPNGGQVQSAGDFQAVLH